MLRELGKLTSIVGGRYARKAAGQSREYTAAESSWIETAVKMLIYRAGEVCFDSNKALPEITITDLPQL